MSRCTIRPIPLVRGPIEKSLYTYRVGSGETAQAAYYVWYIEGPKEKIVVDAGVTAAILTAGGRLGRKDIQSLSEGLGKLGLGPEDIDIVIPTHLHHDHIALLRSFSKARIIVQKKELEAARNPHPVSAGTYRLQKELDDLCYDVIEGEDKITEGIGVIWTPGHTLGGQSVAIETKRGVAVISALCGIRENFEPAHDVMVRMGWSVIPPGVHYNLPQAYDSLLRIKQMAQIIIPIHDTEFIDRETIP